MIYLISLLALLFIVLTFKVITQAKNIIAQNKEQGSDFDPEYLGAPDSANDWNGRALWIYWVVSLILITWSSWYYADDILLDVASEHGRVTDFWFWVTMIVILIPFVLVTTALFWFSYKYKYQKGRKARYYPHNNLLEIVWTTIPAIVMTGLVLSGMIVWNKVMIKAPAEGEAEVVEITGRQFAWMVRYSGPDGKFGDSNYKLIDDAAGNPLGVDFTDKNSFDDFYSATELVVPKGEQILLKIKARDVLHSVFIPHMRIKMDAVPGMPTKFWFTPDVTTDEMRIKRNDPDFEYEIACAEICGKSHFGMRMVLKVVEPDEYERWKREQKSILTLNPDLYHLIPENLKAEASRYISADDMAALMGETVAEEVADAAEDVVAEVIED